MLPDGGIPGDPASGVVPAAEGVIEEAANQLLPAEDGSVSTESATEETRPSGGEKSYTASSWPGELGVLPTEFAEAVLALEAALERPVWAVWAHDPYIHSPTPSELFRRWPSGSVAAYPPPKRSVSASGTADTNSGSPNGSSLSAPGWTGPTSPRSSAESGTSL